MNRNVIGRSGIGDTGNAASDLCNRILISLIRVCQRILILYRKRILACFVLRIIRLNRLFFKFLTVFQYLEGKYIPLLEAAARQILCNRNLEFASRFIGICERCFRVLRVRQPVNAIRIRRYLLTVNHNGCSEVAASLVGYSHNRRISGCVINNTVLLVVRGICRYNFGNLVGKYCLVIVSIFVRIRCEICHIVGNRIEGNDSVIRAAAVYVRLGIKCPVFIGAARLSDFEVKASFDLIEIHILQRLRRAEGDASRTVVVIGKRILASGNGIYSIYSINLLQYSKFTGAVCSFRNGYRRGQLAVFICVGNRYLNPIFRCVVGDSVCTGIIFCYRVGKDFAVIIAVIVAVLEIRYLIMNFSKGERAIRFVCNAQRIAAASSLRHGSAVLTGKRKGKVIACQQPIFEDLGSVEGNRSFRVISVRKGSVCACQVIGISIFLCRSQRFRLSPGICFAVPFADRNGSVQCSISIV